MSCINPDSFKFLLEVANSIKAKIRNPVKPLYKKTLASLYASIEKPYNASINMKLQAILMAACPRALYMCDRNAQGANLAQTRAQQVKTTP